jgi:tRNA(fMet)-specific endonuclease VapC
MISRSYLLDTDTVSYWLRGGDHALNLRLRFMEFDRIAISSVTAAELLYGIRKYPMGHPQRTKVNRFLATANILDWGLPAAEAYADIRHSLTLSANLIGELDMMIAAQALAAGSILVSNNTRHFARLAPPLQLENWSHPAPRP